MKKLDRDEREILSAYEKGRLISARPTKAQLSALRDTARATRFRRKAQSSRTRSGKT